MTSSNWIIISNALAIAATMYFGVSSGAQNKHRTWSAFFFACSTAFTFKALSQLFSRLNTPEFWILLSCAVGAASFLLLTACTCLTRPQWKWLQWLWPLMGLAGVLVGGIFAPLPGAYLLTIVVICILLSVFLLSGASSASIRSWMYAGFILCGVGWLARHLFTFDGILNPASTFDWFELSGIFCLWQGAKR